MDLTPSGGCRSFSATMVTPMFGGWWRPPDLGNVVTVLCQPDSEKAKWDRNEPSTNRCEVQKQYERRRKRQADAEFEEALRERPDARG